MAGSRRERLRRETSGGGLGRHPEALAVQLNRNQIWKSKMKTKLGKPVKFMKSLEGETATSQGAVDASVSSNSALLSATLSQDSHYSHVLYPTRHVHNTPNITERLAVSFQHYLLVCIKAFHSLTCSPYSQA